MIQIELHVGSRYPIDRKKLRQTIKEVLSYHQVDHARVAVSVVGKRKIQQLNQELLNHHGPTDVLSFPFHEKQQLDDFPLPPGTPPHLGDIVISFPAAVDQARRYGRLVDEQICFYASHGLRHLLGYHHE